MIVTATTLPEIVAPISETDDLPNDLSTTQELALWQTFNGQIDRDIDDRGDWLQVELEAGIRYRFALNGTGLSDPYLYLLDSTGITVSTNDDGGPGLNSLMFTQVEETGTYYIRATFYSHWNANFSTGGSYALTFDRPGGERLEGSGLADSITGSTGTDTLIGYGGDDVIDGNFGADRIWAGAGNDTITNVDGRGRIGAGTGDDHITASGSTTIFGGVGNDHITIEGTFQRVYGGTGRDTVVGTEDTHNAQLFLGTGNDRVDLTSGRAFSVDGGAGNDYILFDGVRAFGGLGDDTIRDVGDPGQRASFGNRIDGGEGDDYLIGRSAGRYLVGDSGRDTLEATNAATRMSGGEDNDVARGAAGNDTIFGDLGNDTLEGNGGNDVIFSGDGNDLATGGDGDDRIDGGRGRDRLDGGNGNDQVWGGRGFDTLTAGAGDDTVGGGIGRDSISGGFGNDLMFGGLWHDTLDGGGGNDTLIGDAGRDLFIFSEGEDVIMDFEALGAHDLIDLSAATGIDSFADLSANHAIEEGDYLRLQDDVGNALHLRGVTIADLEEASFIF